MYNSFNFLSNSISSWDGGSFLFLGVPSSLYNEFGGGFLAIGLRGPKSNPFKLPI